MQTLCPLPHNFHINMEQKEFSVKREIYLREIFYCSSIVEEQQFWKFSHCPHFWTRKLSSSIEPLKMAMWTFGEFYYRVKSIYSDLSPSCVLDSHEWFVPKAVQHILPDRFRGCSSLTLSSSSSFPSSCKCLDSYFLFSPSAHALEAQEVVFTSAGAVWGAQAHD